MYIYCKRRGWPEKEGEGVMPFVNFSRIWFKKTNVYKKKEKIVFKNIQRWVTNVKLYFIL